MQSPQTTASRSFWLGTTDPRPLAVFRILFGLVLLHDLADYAPDVRAFLTDEGMLPRSAAHAHVWWARGVFDLTGSFAGVTIIYALGVACVLAFTIGFYTRVATIASWVFLFSLHHRNLYVTDGADDLARVLLFWGIVADFGARYSVDAWRKHKAPRAIPAFGVRLLELQVALLYLVTAILKLRGGWLHGGAVARTLALDAYQRPLGAWMLHHASLCAFASRTIPFMELAIPLLAFSPFRLRKTRVAAIALGAAVQLGIFATMRIGMFTELMLVVLALWIPESWIDRIERADKRSPVLVDAGATSPTRHAFHAAFALQFILAVWDPFLGRRLPLPNRVKEERLATSVTMGYSLFDITYESPRWEAPSTLSNGKIIDAIAFTSPEIRPHAPGLRHSRWSKLAFKSLELPLALPELAAYLCRVYDERATGPKLETFTLVSSSTREELIHFACARATR